MPCSGPDRQPAVGGARGPAGRASPPGLTRVTLRTCVVVLPSLGLRGHFSVAVCA